MADEEAKTAAVAPADAAETKTEAAAKAPEAKGQVYPKLPPRMSKPDRRQFELARGEIESEIKKLTAERERLFEAVKIAENGGGPLREKKNKLRAEIREISSKRNALQSEKNELVERRKKFRDERDALREKSRKLRDSLGKFKTVEDIDRAIERMHYRQSTGSMSLTEEKHMLQQLKELNQLKAGVAEYQAAREAEEKQKSSDGGINELIKAKTKEIQPLQDAIKKCREKLEKLDSEATANQGKVAPLRAKLDVVKKQVSDKYGAVKKLREEWKKENDVFFEHMKEVKRIRAQIRKIEDEEYRKHQAEQQRLREEEEAKTKPWLAEIALCDSLSAYLRGLLPKSSDGSEGAGAAESKSADNTVTMADGTVVQVVRKRDTVDQGGMQFGKSSKSKKKGRKKNRKQKVKTQIRHDMVTLSSFTHLASESGQKLPPPTTTADIEITLKRLADIRAYYDVLPRAKKKKSKKEGKKSSGGVAAGSELDTSYGKVSVLERRRDGVVVAKLQWGKIYLQM